MFHLVPISGDERGSGEFGKEEASSHSRARENRHTNTGPASIIQQPHCLDRSVSTLVLPVIVGVVVVIHPIRPDEIEALSNLLNQPVQRLLVLAVVLGSLLAKRPFVLALPVLLYMRAAEKGGRVPPDKN